MSIKKNLGGRPTKYTSEMPDKLRDYFNVELYEGYTDEVASQGRAVEIYKTRACNFPTFEGFCWDERINRSTLREWCEVHPEFSTAFEECKEKQKTILITHALNNNYNASFAKFLAVNVTDLRDTTHQQIESRNIQINIDMDDNEL